ncbi:CBS domain-containing protein [Flavobacterium limnosediminis JC2902]|uniref:CBS domain-containing protein n=1 Tax=Flavobacterium limnosediminis JC2902 TaxID=1341181 RepID=V6STI9_9FLAO|nr:CBS domain-containing protein [Flavobacterium limnosediminis]ESU29497.1 CBS domain-containing protein [Flavobacterium limnosediminis JC2902]
MTEISEYINKEVDPIHIEDSIESVQDLFLEFPYSHFPVLEDGVYIGCASADDVELLDSDRKIGEFRYTFERFFARDTMIWLDVLEIFAKNETNVVPILDKTNAYIGYYEIADVIKCFHETPFLKEDGGILVVEKGIKDYSMAEIAQIVENNNARLLGLFISHSDLEKIQVTLKLSLGGMNEIIQTFRRYNYEIISEHQEDAYLNNLKDRSDYLDKYLNI